MNPPANVKRLISLDAGDSRIRSCTFTFSELGNPQRAMDFLHVEPGSEWSNRNAIRVLAE